MGVRLVSDPLTLNDKLKVVSVQEAMAHVRISAMDEALSIAQMIGAAYDYLFAPATGWTNGCIALTQTFESTVDARPGRTIDIPLRPFVSLTSLTYRDTAGVYQVMDAGDYWLSFDEDVGLHRISRIPYSWPFPYGTWFPGYAKIQFTAGFGTTKQSIPSELRQAMLMLVGHWYGQRETTGTEGRAVADRVKYGLQELAGRHRYSPDHS